MGSIATAITNAFRNWVTSGVPASGAHNPVKSDIRSLGPLIEQAIATAGFGSASAYKATRSDLNADLDYDPDSTAVVYADATDANNDVYVKVGASGSGSWTLTTILHDIIGSLAGPYATLALQSRVVVNGPIYAMVKEASNGLRVWAGAGELHAEGEDTVTLAAPGEQLLADGEGYFYRISTAAFQSFALSTDTPAWQSNGDYVLLFANIGGELLGPYTDARHTSGFRVVKAGNDIQIHTPELSPFTNRHYRLAFERVTDAPTRKDIWRWLAAVLVERDETGAYDDIRLATDTSTKGVELKMHGKTTVGGDSGQQQILAPHFVFADGSEVSGDDGDWLVDEFEICQHTALYDPDSGGGGTMVAAASMRWKAHMAGNAPALSLLVDFLTLSDISIESLHIGSTAPQWNSSGAGCFDTVYRGPQWLKHVLDDTAFTETASKDTIVKYAGEGVEIGVGDAIVDGLGATMEVEIMPGSDWSDEDRSTLVSATIYGKAIFNWLGREYAPATPADTTLRAQMQWRFGFKGDL